MKSETGALNGKYLGDSYDIVKRFWSEGLRPIAQLYAHAQFIPRGIRTEYASVTTIPVIDTAPITPFGMLLDPDTGIPLPDESTMRATASHAPVGFIVTLIQEFGPEYLICFDQSYHRSKDHSKEQQREKKRRYLRDRGLDSFYYRSHATFLFVARPEVLDAIQNRLLVLGIPRHRFEPAPNKAPHR